MILGILKILKNQKSKTMALNFLEEFFGLKNLTEDDIYKALPI